MEQEFSINKFNMNKIRPGSICVFIGKKNTGKTYLIKDLLYHQSKIPMGMVISGTDHVNESFSSFVPGTFVKKKFKTEILSDIFTKQEAKINGLVKKFKQLYPHKKRIEIIDEHIKPDINNHVFMVLDDCLSDSKNWKNDETIDRIFFEGRHYLIFFLLAMQYPLGITPKHRTNIDYIFLTFTNNNQDIKKLYDSYGGFFNDFKTFKEILDQCTDDFNCMVIDNSTNSKVFSEKVYYYKAKNHPLFEMCCKNNGNRCNHQDCPAWKYHYKMESLVKPKTTTTVNKNKKIILNKYS
jgi:hypothetical protein